MKITKEEIKEVLKEGDATIEGLLNALVETSSPENMLEIAISLSKTVVIRDAYKLLIENE